MAFFDDLSKKISKATQTTVQKAQEMAEVAKLNSMVSDEEKRIEDAYLQIGKTYCELHKDNYEEAFATAMESIVAANEKIVELKKQIQTVKGVVICAKCGAEVPSGSSFCSACGGQIIVEAAPAAEEATATEEPAVLEGTVEPTVETASEDAQ